MVKKAKIMAVLGILILCGSARATEGLIAHWKFDEGSGTTAYDSAGENDGTIYGATWTTGQIDSALEFDGDNDYVSLSKKAITTTEFTISAWANHYGPGGGANSGNVIFEQRNDPTSLSTVVIWTDWFGVARAFVRDSDNIKLELTYPRKDCNQWHHYAVTVNSTDFILYIDGVEVNRTTDTHTGDYVTSIDYVDIGRHRFAGVDHGFFNGSIDDVRIYDRALSAEEIQQLYQEEFSGSELAIANIEGAIAEKQEVLAGIEAALEKEQVAYEALRQLLKSKDYGDLSRKDISKAKQKIRFSMRCEKWSKRVLAKSIEKLQDALMSLGWEPEPEPGPIAHWKFDEGEGTTAYDSAGDNDGTIYGATYTTGQINGALGFDGVNDYVDCGNPPDGSLDFGTNDFTIGAWVKFTDNSSERTIVAKRAGGTGDKGYQLLHSAAGGQRRIAFDIDDDTSPKTVFAQTLLNDGSWHFIVGVRDGNKLRIYVDGYEDVTPVDIAGYGSVSSANTLRVGRKSGTSEYYWNGTIDDVRIYDEALSAEEIQQLYQEGLSGP